MEKRIILTMQPNKDIIIQVNNERKLTIKQDERTVKADAIYSIIDYSRGDEYTVEGVNAQNVDVPVLQFFVELFQDICRRLHAISAGGQEEQGETKEEVVEVPYTPEDTDELPF